MMYNWNKCVFLLNLASSLYVANGFLVGPSSTRQDVTCYATNGDVSRRKALTQFVGLTVATTIASSSPANAKDEIFKKNPLTNSVLEQIRIWEQAEADELKYGGELAPGTPPVREAYAKLLVPILGIAQDLDTLADLLLVESMKLEEAQTILLKSQFEKIQFKKIFNAFADNIYYTDPDRANAYLGGGATPKNVQSIAYLYRNDILDNVEALQAEVSFLLKEQKNGNNNESTDDLRQYINKGKESMIKYLELVPPGEMKAAREILLNKSSNV